MRADDPTAAEQPKPHKPKPSRKSRPSATPRARAQKQAYASPGEAIAPGPVQAIVFTIKNPIAQALATRRQGAPLVVAPRRPRNHRRAEAVRQARSEVPSTPVNLPGPRPEVRHPAGSTIHAPKQRPLAFLDKLSKSGHFTADDGQQRAAARQQIDHHVGLLMHTGRSLHRQEQSIERLRQLGALPGNSEFQTAVNRFRSEQKHKQTDADLCLTDPEELQRARFKKEGALDEAAELPGKVLPTLGAAAYQTARASIEDPGDVIPKTAGGSASRSWSPRRA